MDHEKLMLAEAEPGDDSCFGFCYWECISVCGVFGCLTTALAGTVLAAAGAASIATAVAVKNNS